MKSLMHLFSRLHREEDGAVAIEYGLLAVLIALAITAGASALGGQLDTTFQNIATCLKTGAC